MSLQISPAAGPFLQLLWNLACGQVRSERNLCFYARDLFEANHPNGDDSKEYQAFRNIYLAEYQFQQILKKLDNAFVNHLARYFDVDRAGILIANKNLRAAESGSYHEAELMCHNANLWRHRFSKPRHYVRHEPIEPVPNTQLMKRLTTDDFIDIPHDPGQNEVPDCFANYSSVFKKIIQWSP